MQGVAKKGFTLVEVLVSVALLAIGIVGTLGAMTSLNLSAARVKEVEHVQILATRKIDELLATQAVQQTGTSGDFTDEGEPNYQWKADVSPSGTTDLQILTLTVTKNGADDRAPSAVLDTVFFVPPTNTGGTGATGQ